MCPQICAMFREGNAAVKAAAAPSSNSSATELQVLLVLPFLIFVGGPC